MRDYEEAYREFIDSKEFEIGEHAWFKILRDAYDKGWVAAGGTLPEEPKKKNEDEL
jgi:hypothetical protein